MIHKSFFRVQGTDRNDGKVIAETRCRAHAFRIARDAVETSGQVHSVSFHRDGRFARLVYVLRPIPVTGRATP